MCKLGSQSIGIPTHTRLFVALASGGSGVPARYAVQALRYYIEAPCGAVEMFLLPLGWASDLSVAADLYGDEGTSEWQLLASVLFLGRSPDFPPLLLRLPLR